MVKASKAGAGNERIKPLTLRLDADVWRRLKHRAVDEERPVSEIIRDAIDAYLSNDRCA